MIQLQVSRKLSKTSQDQARLYCKHAKQLFPHLYTGPYCLDFRAALLYFC